MSQVLVIRKPDRTIHKVPIENEAALKAYNSRLPQGQQWTFEKLNQEEANKLPFIDPHYVTAAQAKSELAKLQEENQKLRDQLRTQGASPDGAGTLLNKVNENDNRKADMTDAQTSTQGNHTDSGNNEDAGKPDKAVDVIKKINAANSIEEVKELSKDDDRVTVKDAAKEKIAVLKK